MENEKRENHSIKSKKMWKPRNMNFVNSKTETKSIIQSALIFLYILVSMFSQSELENV
jgi:hypothetical protein